MSVAEEVGRRRGGRDARRALRARPIPQEEAAVRPGMEGGRYKPLTERELQRIHEAALHLLETVGIGQAIPSCIELMTARGCTMDARGRLCIPRALVEDTIASCARRFPLYGRDPRHDMEPWGNKVYFGTAGAAVHIVEPETRTYRESLLVDLYDAARIVDTCDHIHYLPAHAHRPRHVDRARSRYQHHVCLHGRHLQACRHQHGRRRACGGSAADAPSRLRWRGQMARSGLSCRSPTASSCRR